jgi:hypothetical protein
MSETTITTAEPVVETTEVVSEETPKRGFLKRFASAFAAKVTQAAKAVQSAFVRLFGDNETEIPENEGFVRKAARFITAIPKWATLVALKAAQAVVWFALLVITVVVTVVLLIAAAIVFAIALAIQTVFKVLQGIALIARTPYLLVRGDDCFATDWKGYLLGWTPRFFMTTSIQQVYFMRQLDAETAEIVAENLAETEAPLEAKPTLTAHAGGKGKATPRRKPKSSPRTKRTELHTLAGTAVAPA